MKAALDSLRLVTGDEDRRESYLALLKALDAVPDLAVTPEYSRFRNEAVEKLVHDVAAMQERVRGEEETLANAPVKPEYDPPKYIGARYLEGAVKRCYNDGVAIDSGSKYYFLRNEPCPPLANILQGYVEDTFDTVQLDLGRDGRTAIVVNVRDKETAEDDRARYRTEVAEYQKQYQEDLKAFRVASNERKEFLRQAPARTARSEVARVAAERLDRLLAALAKGDPLDAATIDEAAKAVSVQSEEGVGAETKPSATSDRAARQPASKVASRSPMACMKACIVSCHGDADCERRCVARDCR